VVEVQGSRLSLDAKNVTLDELGERLKTLVETADSPAPWVVIRASGDQKYSDVLRVSEAIRGSGVSLLRFQTPQAGQ